MLADASRGARIAQASGDARAHDQPLEGNCRSPYLRLAEVREGQQQHIVLLRAVAVASEGGASMLALVLSGLVAKARSCC